MERHEARAEANRLLILFVVVLVAAVAGWSIYSGIRQKENEATQAEAREQAFKMILDEAERMKAAEGISE